MRLIDLDKALAEAENECRMSDDWKVSHEMMNVFKYQPTVKAVPIEYIKAFKKEFRAVASVKEVIDWLLEEWEKENERP